MKPARLYSIACWAHHGSARVGLGGSGREGLAPQLNATYVGGQILPTLEAVDVARFMLVHGQCGRVVGWFVDEDGKLTSDEPRHFGPLGALKIAEWALEALEAARRVPYEAPDPVGLLEAATSAPTPATHPPTAPALPPRAAAPLLPAGDASPTPAPTSPRGES